MSRIIAICNQKGGVGKTTTAVNLAAALAASETPTLLVDFDPQGNAGSGLGVPPGRASPNVYDALLGATPVERCLLQPSPDKLPHLWLCPSTHDLTGAEIELVSLERREHRLAQTLAPLAARFPVILVDCGPSLGLLTVNALVAAGSVLVPVQCEYYALEGISHLLRTVELVRGSLNPALELEGVLLTMFDQRNNLSHQVAEEIRKHFGRQVFDRVVPRNVRLSEAPSFGRPILEYDVDSRGSQAYLGLADDLLRRWKKKGARLAG